MTLGKYCKLFPYNLRNCECQIRRAGDLGGYFRPMSVPPALSKKVYFLYGLRVLRKVTSAVKTV